jgi:hypothetical protein
LAAFRTNAHGRPARCPSAVTTAHLQARQHLGPFRNQRHHRIGKLAQQTRIG